MNVEVAFFWHFHQPVYSRPEDPTLPLPWVRLHAVKDYLDMLRHLKRFPGLKATFNFTPSLLCQLVEYQQEKCTDRQLYLFQKRAEELTLEEKTEILRDFFLANWTQMIEPHPRYFALLLKRGKNIVEDELAALSQGFPVDEIRDLQVWSNLVWIDPLFRDDIADLYRQGRNFAEADKDRVLAVEKNIIGRIIDEYRKAFEDGQIELTTSPMYHPILPLLIDSSLAKVANPGVEIPFQFAHPEDAREQINRGLKCFEKCFGRKPRGLWPSEGSVCQDLMPILAEAGIEWTATDEEILSRSINTGFVRDENGIPANAAKLYQPWRSGSIKLIFRDHVLSDLIAFNYHAWDQKKAARDMVARIKNIAKTLSPFEKFIIPIILDGENAWEYFANDGSEFIESLYQELTDQKVPTTTVSGFLAKQEATGRIDKLFPGSWIGANFDIWIGRPQDHKAWLVVRDLRQRLVEKNITDPAVWDRFYVLEGSDWYWWFGDDFFSVTGEVFDDLFRTSAIWIYRKIGDEPPHELFSMINRQTEIFCKPPINKISPAIDGRVTHFYEWVNAGSADVKRMGGTMQRFAGVLSTIFYGFDGRKIYIRCDVINSGIDKYRYSIDFEQPKKMSLNLDAAGAVEFKIGEIIEIAVPYELLGVVTPGRGPVEFVVRAWAGNTEVDRTPLLAFNLGERELSLYNWTV